jgi:hypothetical protein
MADEIRPKRKKTGGRKKGTPNKVSTDLKALMRAKAPTIYRRLLKLTNHADPNVRLRALELYTNRAWGRPEQPLTGDSDNPVVVSRIERVIVRAGQETAADKPAEPDTATPDAPKLLVH